MFERDFAVRWLTSLIARADEIAFSSDEARSKVIDDAAFILSSFSDSTDEGAEEALTRDFSFPTPLASRDIQVRLNDAPLSTTDHTDVGLQSWGASIIISGLMCASPDRFYLDKLQPGSTVVELGAGTGLVSLTLATLLPHIRVTQSKVVATDYHPAVLENLRSNIATNFPSQDPAPVHTMLLDWSAPVLAPPLDKPIPMLVAADVIYAPEHATWLRDCAGLLLAPDGVFWLIVTVRTVGKFEGIADTVETAFTAEDCPRKDGRILKILEKERVEKRRGIGRGDERWYNLYRIGWA
jgi:predicted nicotinamide N-methyase